MLAKKKASMFMKSDLYRRWLVNKLLNDIPRAARRTLRDFDPDDVLRYAGLTTRKPVARAMGGFGVFIVGAAVGSIVALMLAPRPGAELRHTVKDKAMGYINKQSLGIGAEKQANA